MSDERVLVSLDAAIGMLRVRDGDVVHTIRQASHGEALIGADWPRDKLISAMRRSPLIDITGQSAQALGHGLCIHDEHGPLFIETRPEAKPEPDAPVLSIWTLFDSPSDCPGMYVLRRFEVDPTPRPTADAWISQDIEQLREFAHAMGLYCLGREEGDEPRIVESWI